MADDPLTYPPGPRLVPAAPYRSALILYLGVKSSDASDVATQFIRLSFGYIMKFQIGSDIFFSRQRSSPVTMVRLFFYSSRTGGKL